MKNSESTTENTFPFTSDVKFEEPWQAQTFSITVLLNKAGFFEWKDWVKTFARHIAISPQRTEETVQKAYYRQWLSALEQLLDDKGLTSQISRSLYQENWRRSYIATEHGSPVIFKKDHPISSSYNHSHDHDHDHDHCDSHSHVSNRVPIFVSPACN